MSDQPPVQPPVQWLPPPTDYYGYGYPPPPPRRSSTPTVVGILMIIFAGLGLLVTMVALGASDTILPKGDMAVLGEAGKKIRQYHYIEQSIWLFVGVLHLVAGILCVMRKRFAPT